MEERKRILIEKFLDSHIGFDLIRNETPLVIDLEKNTKNDKISYFYYNKKEDILFVDYDMIIKPLFSVFNVRDDYGIPIIYDTIKDWILMNYNINVQTINGYRRWEM
jgi:hypothetical protein